MADPMTTRRRARRITGVLVFLLAAGCGSGAQPSMPPVPALSNTQSPSNPSGGTAAPATPEPTMSAATTTAPAPGQRPECRSADLTLSVAGSDGAAGHVYRSLQFTNHSGRTCVLQGYPGVSYVAGVDGHQVGPAAARDGGPGPLISLAPGRSAAAVVTVTDTGLFDPDVCHPVQVRGLRVYPPDEQAALYLPLPGTGCTAATPSPQLRVRALTPG